MLVSWSYPTIDLGVQKARENPWILYIFKKVPLNLCSSYHRWPLNGRGDPINSGSARYVLGKSEARKINEKSTLLATNIYILSGKRRFRRWFSFSKGVISASWRRSPFKGPHDTPFAPCRNGWCWRWKPNYPCRMHSSMQKWRKRWEELEAPPCMFVVFLSPLFSTLGWMVWVEKESHDITIFCLNTSSHFGEKDSEPPIPTIISSSTESTSEVLGVAERGEGDATWLQMMLRCNQKKAGNMSINWVCFAPNSRPTWLFVWELTYPIKVHFWRWCSFSAGQIC